ncbi:MAG: universal stress protein [Hyphomonadaceae bacterium]
MDVREVLVFADGPEEQARARVAAAWALAQKSGAHLEAIRFAPMPLALAGVVTPSLQSVYDQVVAANRAEANAFLKSLSAVAEFGPVFSAYAPSAPYGKIRAAAAAAARNCDFAIVGQPETGDETAVDTEILLGALLNGGAPCLVLPRTAAPHAFGRRVLIAWKGTPEAARAVRAATPFLRQAERVHIVVVDPRVEWEGEDQNALRRLATYIERHGVAVEDPIVMPAGDLEHGADVAIASELERIGGDLLVMGGYGHARWTQFLLGGVTGKVLRAARTAIFMAH